MKIAICEDQREEAGWLKKQIEDWGLRKSIPAIITLYENAKQFWFDYDPEKYFDVLILDVEMPGENGISLARQLRQKQDDIPIIFVTGAIEYMSEGYDVQAVHYLLKPVDKNKLEECLQRVYEKLEAEEPPFVINTNKGVIRLTQKEIIKIESFSRYCIYTTLKGEYQVNISLKDAMKDLKKEHFAYTHRGILVNLKHVETITREQVTLTQGYTALISRRQYADFNKAFITYYNGGSE